MRLNWRLLAGLLVATVSSCTIGQVPSNNIVERLHQAEIENSIDGPDMKPWHLKMSFQTFAGKGITKDQGAIEEWWAPGKHRITITSGEYTGTELQNEQGRFLTTGVGSIPYRLEALLNGAVHPLPTPASVGATKPELMKETIAKVPMDCLMLTEEVGLKMQAAPIGMFPTYCMFRGTNQLIFSFSPGSETVVLNRMGKFAGHAVAVELTLQNDDIVVAKAHVDALSSSASDIGDFTTTTGLDDANAPAPNVDQKTMEGYLVTRPNPIYPESAKRAHVSGAVILRAVIGRDGRIRRLRVQSAPDAALAMAALQAVRQWVFKPYLLNGVPTEAVSVVTVNFTFG